MRMDGSKKRRICGAAAFSATAIATLLGAQPAGAAQERPPGLAQACLSRPVPDSPTTLSFKMGWPAKWDAALRCDGADDSAVYDWWKKVE